MHPQRSVITRALGAGPSSRSTRASSQVRDGDVLLLCSDGLSRLVGDEAIARLLERRTARRRRCDGLVRAANDAGGDDNVTAVAFRHRAAIRACRARPCRPAAPDRGRSRPLGHAHRGRRACRRSGCRPPEPPARAARPLDAPPATADDRWRSRPFVLVVAALRSARVGGLYWAHFVGVDPATGERRRLPGRARSSIDSGHHLYRLVSRSSVLGHDAAARASASDLFDHTLRSSSDADAASCGSCRRPSPDAGASAHGAQPRARQPALPRRPHGCGLHGGARRALGRDLVDVARVRRRSSSRSSWSRTSRCACDCRRPIPTCCRSSGILASVGLCEIYRIRPALARDQALWMAIGVAVFVAVLVLLPRLPRARALPLPAAARSRSGCSRHDPVVLRDRHRDQRRARVDPRRRPLVPAGRAREGTARPVPGRLPARASRAARADADARARASGCRRCGSSRPLLAMLGAALLLLVAMNDFGTSLLFFGVFVAHACTSRRDASPTP